MTELNLADDIGKNIQLLIAKIGQYAAITELDDVINYPSAHSQDCDKRKQVVDGKKFSIVLIRIAFRSII